LGDVRLRSVGVVTTARSDYGIALPMLRAIEADPKLEIRLIVGGMHLVREFGHTIDAIHRDGFPIADRIEMMLASDTPLGVAKSIGLGVMSFAESYARARPDVLLVVGDRFEMHAAVLASLPFGIPVAHVHGGEVTEGAIDDSLRHGITKIAHLHFTSTQESARRVVCMGEEPWRVTVSGAPSLDNLQSVRPLSASELEERLHFPFEPAPLLVTYHPVTRELDRMTTQVDALLEALDLSKMPILFTAPNADSGGRYIAKRIEAFVAMHDASRLFDNFGTDVYFGVMRAAAAMVGNSSSGIIEAASFALPVVNLGSRQAGRTRSRNVVDVESDEDAGAIVAAIVVATGDSFRDALRDLQNPYAHGGAAAKIVGRLRDEPLDAKLLRKKFHDV
jgi:UDP-hydrolysing UDP-N-acetyl-D-glucosamine 2-epimerase